MSICVYLFINESYWNNIELTEQVYAPIILEQRKYLKNIIEWRSTLSLRTMLIIFKTECSQLYLHIKK